MSNHQFAVIVQEQGQRPKLAMVGSGANVASALRAIKKEGYKGSLTVNGKKADATTRLSKGQVLALTPDVAGGSR